MAAAREGEKLKGGIKIKRLLSLFVLLLLILPNNVFADSTNSSPESAPVISTDQGTTPEKNFPLWVSYANDGKSESVGFFARRMGEKKKEAIELTYIVFGDDRGYGIDYFRFFDTKNDSAWFIGIGGYAIHIYKNNNTKIITEDKIAVSFGYQKTFDEYLVGLGFNSVRGFCIQLGKEF